MRRIVLVGFALLALLCGGLHAEAGNYRNSGLWRYYDYPWCLSVDGGMADCSYATLQQCLVARSGTGGGCNVNPRIAYQPPPPRRQLYAPQ